MALPPDTERLMQEEIDAATKEAENDPAKKAQVDEAIAAARKSTDEAQARRVCGSGYVGALYIEFAKRGLVEPKLYSAI